MSRSVVFFALAGLIVLGPAAAPAADRGDSSAEASRALERAVSLFEGGASPGDATMILRDLVFLRGELSGQDRALADAILARPTNADPAKPGFDQKYTVDAERECSTVNPVCVHWVESTEHAVDLTDDDEDDIPDWVQTTIATMDIVTLTEVDTYGYRKPKSDITSADNGGDDWFDVYLVELGGTGFYGYCTTDDPNADPASGYQYSDYSAFCVFDNDYDPSEFGGDPALDSLRVTAAHEFFHAVQYAYDATAGRWLMEGTAVWMEDQVFDEINQNLMYLKDGQLGAPAIPLNVTTQVRNSYYGNWIWWRYLADGYGAEGIQEIFEFIDASPVGTDGSTLAAIEAVLVARGSSFRRAYTFFGWANVEPAGFYSEGATYPDASIDKTHSLTSRRPKTPLATLTRDHLTHGYISLKPGADLGRGSKVRVEVALPTPDRVYYPGATVLVVSNSGEVDGRSISVKSNGEGARTVDFGRTVSRVVIVFTNANTLNDGAGFLYRATVVD